MNSNILLTFGWMNRSLIWDWFPITKTDLGYIFDYFMNAAWNEQA